MDPVQQTIIPAPTPKKIMTHRKPSSNICSGLSGARAVMERIMSSPKKPLPTPVTAAAKMPTK